MTKTKRTFSVPEVTAKKFSAACNELNHSQNGVIAALMEMFIRGEVEISAPPIMALPTMNELADAETSAYLEGR